MKRGLPYFDVPAIVRFGIKPWSTPPHEFLANMPITEDAAAAFCANYGPLFENFYLLRPAPKTVRESMELPRRDRKPPLSLDMFRATQTVIRDAWVNRGPQIELTANAKGAGLLQQPVNTSWTITADGGLELSAADAWSYMRMACAVDASRGKLHVCRNSACNTPYVREGRAGQVYCSHTCAVAIAVDRFQAKKKAAKQVKRGAR
jgi:hypothetical protein